MVQALGIVGYDQVSIAAYMAIAPKTLRKHFKRELAFARMGLLSMAASGLAAALKRNEPWAICFTLKCLGRDKGWSERQENTGADGGPIEIRVKLAKSNLQDKLLQLEGRLLEKLKPHADESGAVTSGNAGAPSGDDGGMA